MTESTIETKSEMDKVNTIKAQIPLRRTAVIDHKLSVAETAAQLDAMDS